MFYKKMINVSKLLFLLLLISSTSCVIRKEIDIVIKSPHYGDIETKSGFSGVEVKIRDSCDYTTTHDRSKIIIEHSLECKRKK